MASSARKLAAAVALTMAGVLVSNLPAGAVTFNVLHTFTGGADGANPLAGLTIDKAGNVYGTAQAGGAGYGTAFRLKHSQSHWTFRILHTFSSGQDGAAPGARILPGPLGRLYGTTTTGDGGGGTVFDLGPTMKRDPRHEHTLFGFTGGGGYEPSSGDLMFDSKGNIYGTTSYGGAYGNGAVFELQHLQRGWRESVLYSFGSGGDGTTPVAGVIADAAGNLYGTTSAGGTYNYGTVYELSPSGSGWHETILHNFAEQGDGTVPYAGLTFDRSGNLYGAATEGGSASGGTIFMLSPSGSGWTFNTLYSVPGWGVSGPFRTPIVDAAGNIFATTHCDGANSQGSVFELTHSGSGWTYTALHDFTGGADGGFIFSNPVFDAHGNIYGTAQIGGSGYGVVWEISP